METIIIYPIIIYVIICLIVGISGSERQIGFINSFLLSLILTPLVGFVITVLSSNKIQKTTIISGDSIDYSEEELTDKPEHSSELYLSEIEKLFELKEKGILTQSEYEIQKKKILNN